jgi:hypothetical protein
MNPRRQAPATAAYAHLRDVRTQSDQPTAPAEPAFWSSPLAMAMAGFMILAAYLVVMTR